MTDKQRLDWLCARVSYLEHSAKDGTTAHQTKLGGYWPQDDTDPNPEDGMEELSLIDYINAQIAKEG